MRVISGKYKGRNLDAPKGATRPTLDRTKETLFNILNFQIPNARVLDLFAGSGQLGIECLSRGAKEVVFCDNNKDAVNTVRTNCQKVGQTPQIYFCGYNQCLQSVMGGFDIVFIDPPYQSNYYADVLQEIVNKKILTSEGIAVCEMSATLPAVEICGLKLYDQRKIGTVQFCFYKGEKA